MRPLAPTRDQRPLAEGRRLGVPASASGTVPEGRASRSCDSSWNERMAWGWEVYAAKVVEWWDGGMNPCRPKCWVDVGRDVVPRVVWWVVLCKLWTLHPAPGSARCFCARSGKCHSHGQGQPMHCPRPHPLTHSHSHSHPLPLPLSYIAPFPLNHPSQQSTSSHTTPSIMPPKQSEDRESHRIHMSHPPASTDPFGVPLASPHVLLSKEANSVSCPRRCVVLTPSQPS